MADEFTRDKLIKALQEIGRRCYEAGRTVELAIYGGSALMLVMNHRVSTRDVDAVFESDKELIRNIANDMAEEFGWDPGWLNDAVKGWLSALDNAPEMKRLFKAYPSEECPGLRVFIPKLEYLFAMKCIAMRIGGVEENSDIEDIQHLAKDLGLQTTEEALDIVQKYYPSNIIKPSTKFGLDELFSNMSHVDDKKGFKP